MCIRDKKEQLLQDQPINFNTGDMILVRANENHQWDLREFVVYHHGFYHCVSDTGCDSLRPWKYAAPAYRNPIEPTVGPNGKFVDYYVDAYVFHGVVKYERIGKIIGYLNGSWCIETQTGVIIWRSDVLVKLG